jgi:1-deoxy-D-xylulose-5-phosphate reductoisomerase
MSEKKGIAILGSTGSIGKQALEVVDAHSDRFFVSVLTAYNNADLLIEQALKYRPNAVVIGNEDKFAAVKDVLFEKDIKVFAGSEAIEQIVEIAEINIVLNAILGIAGLKPTINTILSHKTLAQANKESIVVAGDYISKLYTEKGGNIIPVDSEHSAIFQTLVGEFQNPIEKVVLTASGGPFLGKDQDYLQGVTVKEALNHPTWRMGNKISIDSATLLNKGFEIIETQWLFNLDYKNIEIVIHPESIIHTVVYFSDGTMKSVMSNQDMKIPIQYAFSFPERMSFPGKRIDLISEKTLTFSDPDFNNFPNLKLAYHVLEKGGNTACILNAGNEIAVRAFLNKKISFNKIFEINNKCLENIDFIDKPTLDQIFETDKETRKFAERLI